MLCYFRHEYSHDTNNRTASYLPDMPRIESLRRTLLPAMWQRCTARRYLPHHQEFSSLVGWERCIKPSTQLVSNMRSKRCTITFATQAERDEGIMRFVEEAKLLRDLNHPAIPKVYRSFIDEGRYYLSMEFIYGEDLEDMLKREQRFSEDVVLQWADQLCDVMEYMHSAGLIYRDMKPSNIMIDRDNQVKLVDFGIAKLLEPGQRNTMVGTPGYSPPEQYQGLATVQSDIYALGATLHHLLTGRDPRDHPPFSFPFATTLNPAISMRTAKAIDKALADGSRRPLPYHRGVPQSAADSNRRATADAHVR